MVRHTVYTKLCANVILMSSYFVFSGHFYTHTFYVVQALLCIKGEGRLNGLHNTPAPPASRRQFSADFSNE